MGSQGLSKLTKLLLRVSENPLMGSQGLSNLTKTPLRVSENLLIAVSREATSSKEFQWELLRLPESFANLIHSVRVNIPKSPIPGF